MRSALDHLVLPASADGPYYRTEWRGRPSLLLESTDGKTCTVQCGPRGNLKLQPMTDIVSDTEGQIFATKNGKLRFIVGPSGAQSSWIKGNKVTRLIAVPVDTNGPLIYNDLGVYSGQRLGTPCDDL